jgi:adenosylcobyric acid synthase
MKTKRVMIQGTASSVGKSLITTGLLNMLAKQGRSCAPFKSQNVTSYSYVTRDGLEIAWSQAVQALAAGIEPEVNMNPILLKPVSGKGCQVVLMGRPYGDLAAEEYDLLKPKLYEVIRCCFNGLAEKYEIILIEGAGSPVEINLLDNDIVNMGVADLLDSPVILVTDIERGGMFASVVGTLALMTEAQRQRVRGVIINKYIGEAALFAEGARMLEDIIKIPVLGIIPYGDFDIEEEDALTGMKGFPGHLTNRAGAESGPPAGKGIDEAGSRQREYDRLGEHIKNHLDMDRFYAILDGSV